MKKINNFILSFLIAIITVSAFAGCSLENDDVYKEEYQKVFNENYLSRKITDVYYQQKIGTMPVYVDENTKIPYISLYDTAELYYGTGIDYYTENNLTTVIWNGAKMEISHDTGIVNYDDYGTFYTGKTIVADGYLVGFYNKRYVKGDAVSINLKDYHIPYKFVRGTLVLPISVATNLINPYLTAVYNGNSLYVNPSSYIKENGTDTVSKNYWKSKKEYISKELAELNYNEMCLIMDYFYGLKKEHEINDFDTFFKNNDLKNKLSSTDVAVAGSAVYELTDNLIDDLHSGFNLTSPYIGKGNNISGTVKSVSTQKLIDDRNYLISIRDKKNSLNQYVYPAAQYNFYVKGNTAFLKFDSFQIHMNYKNMRDSFSTAKIDTMTATEAGKYISFGSTSQSRLTDFCNACINNTTGTGYGWSFKSGYENDVYLLTIFANYCIKKINATASSDANKIKNVVVDLSVNTGGAVDSCVFISGWLCGGGYMTSKTTIDNSVRTWQYFSDVNCDSKFETTVGCADNIADLNRIIITSPVSFSCGNLLPTIADQNSRITLMGKRSGGGCCFVKNSATDNGTAFQLSGISKSGTLQNGTFIPNENGIEVDVNVPLENFASFYDRDSFAVTYGQYLR